MHRASSRQMQKRKDHLWSWNNPNTSHRAVRVTICKHHTRRGLTPGVHTMTRTDVPNVVTQPTWRDSSVQWKNTSAKFAISLDILQASVFRKSKLTSNPEDQKHTSCQQVQFMWQEVPCMTTQMRNALVKIHFTCKSRPNASRHKNENFQEQCTW